jgi:hypothetical protein
MLFTHRSNSLLWSLVWAGDQETRIQCWTPFILFLVENAFQKLAVISASDENIKPAWLGPLGRTDLSPWTGDRGTMASIRNSVFL